MYGQKLRSHLDHLMQSVYLDGFDSIDSYVQATNVQNEALWEDLSINIAEAQER